MPCGLTRGTFATLGLMKAIVLAVLAGLLWGVGEVCTKAVLQGGKVGPFTALGVRTLVALPLIMLAWLIAARLGPTEPAHWTRMPTSDWTRLLLGSGLAAGALAIICFYAALSLAEVSRIKPIAFALAPATAVLLGWLALGEPMSARKAVGVALILAGVVLLTGAGKR